MAVTHGHRRSGLWAALLLGVISPAPRADIVISSGARVAVGEVVHSDGDRVVVRTREGDEISISVGRIIEHTTHATAGAYYEERAGALGHDDVIGHRQLASFCRRVRRWDLLAYEVATLRRLIPGDPLVAELTDLLEEHGTDPPVVPEEARCVLWLLRDHQVLESYETPDGQLLDARGRPQPVPAAGTVVERIEGLTWRNYLRREDQALDRWDLPARLELALYARGRGDTPGLRQQLMVVKGVDPRHPLLLRLLGREISDEQIDAATRPEGFAGRYLRRHAQLQAADVEARLDLLRDCLRRGARGLAASQASAILEVDETQPLARLVAGLPPHRPGSDLAEAGEEDDGAEEPSEALDAGAVGLVWVEERHYHEGSRPPAAAGRRYPDRDSLQDLKDDPPDLGRTFLVGLLTKGDLQVYPVEEFTEVVETHTVPVRPRYWVEGSFVARERGAPRTFFGATLAYVFKVEGNVLVGDRDPGGRRAVRWSDVAEGRHHDRRKAVELAAARLRAKLEVFLRGRLPLGEAPSATGEEEREE